MPDHLHFNICLRDHFAASAAAALVAQWDPFGSSAIVETTAKIIADRAYIYADALLARRNQEPAANAPQG